MARPTAMKLVVCAAVLAMLCLSPACLVRGQGEDDEGELEAPTLENYVALAEEIKKLGPEKAFKAARLKWSDFASTLEEAAFFVQEMGKPFKSTGRSPYMLAEEERLRKLEEEEEEERNKPLVRHAPTGGWLGFFDPKLADCFFLFPSPSRLGS